MRTDKMNKTITINIYDNRIEVKNLFNQFTFWQRLWRLFFPTGDITFINYKLSYQERKED